MTAEAYESVAGDWEELAERVGAPPFMRPGWFDAWVEAFGRGARVTVLTAREGDRLTAVLPVLAARGRHRIPTNSHTPVFDVVAEDEPAARAVVAELVGGRFAQLDLPYLDAEGLLYQAVRELATPGSRLLNAGGLRSPYVRLDGDLASFRAGLSRNFRRQLDRRRRRLEELGELSFEFTDGGADGLDALLDAGFELEGSGWKVAEGAAIVSDPRRVRFYRRVAEWARERGWLTLAFARLDGRPIAFDFCLEQGGRVYVLKGGYDPDYGKFGVSFLLIEETIARAFAAGRTSYELLGDADDYKLQLTDAVRERAHLQLFGRGPAGYMRYVGYRRVRPALKRLRR
jgi:CelD/BcsL family acetyltransferase involved in cellulose biosynthesis